jgi:flagellar biosynthesis protein FlhF
LETKRFIGNDTTRLFARIRRELGPDAVILSTRSIHREGAAPLVEILAAPADASADALPLHLQQIVLEEAIRRAETAPGVTVADLEELAAAEAPASPPRERTAFEPAPPTPLLSPGDEVVEALARLGWDRATARLVADAAPAARDPREALEHWLHACPAVYPGEGATALVTIQGAEGSGRTTALLKMALDCADAGRPAVLVAADSARAGAHDAVRACADALGLPFHDAFGPGDLVRAVSRAPRGACLFVDCPAGSWTPPPIPGVAHFAYLALPAHWQPAATRAAIQDLPLARFSGAVPTGVDLAPSLAGALELLAETGLGLAFLSAGRDIAAGIVVADPAAIAAAIFPAPSPAARLAASA